MVDYKELADKWDKYLASPEGQKSIEDFVASLPPPSPKGWNELKEDNLPMWMASDLEKGYSEYLVKDANGNEQMTRLTDHHTWYILWAIPEGITHWFNP